MVQKVMIKELGKSYEIGKSNYDMELALRYSEKVGEMQKEAMKADPNDYLSSIKSTLEVLEARKDYLQEALHLSDKELDSYNHKLTPNEFNYACERVLLLVQGNTPKEADESVQHLKRSTEEELNAAHAGGKEESADSSK